MGLSSSSSFLLVEEKREGGTLRFRVQKLKERGRTDIAREREEFLGEGIWSYKKYQRTKVLFRSLFRKGEELREKVHEGRSILMVHFGQAKEEKGRRPGTEEERKEFPGKKRGKKGQRGTKEREGVPVLGSCGVPSPRAYHSSFSLALASPV